MDTTEVQRIAGAIHHLRPDWPIASIRTLIDANLQTRSYRDVALALTWVACDPRSRTPKRVVEPGPWWSGGSAAGNSPGLPPPMCRRCWTPHRVGDDCPRHEPGNPERIAELKAIAKANAARCRSCDAGLRCAVHPRKAVGS